MRVSRFVLLLGFLPTAALAALSNAERKSQFEKAMTSIIAAASPTLPSPVRETVVKDYIACKANKAQAVVPKAPSTWRSCEHEDGAPVADRVLEACQLRYGKPCAVVAINDEIVVEGDLVPRDMPRLRYAGRYDVEQIPVIRKITRSRSDIQNYDKAMEPKAMAIHPWGKVFISAGDPTAKDAQTSVLSKCNTDPQRNGRDGSCLIYAVNNDVVLTERREFAVGR